MSARAWIIVAGIMLLPQAAPAKYIKANWKARREVKALIKKPGPRQVYKSAFWKAYKKSTRPALERGIVRWPDALQGWVDGRKAGRMAVLKTYSHQLSDNARQYFDRLKQKDRKQQQRLAKKRAPQPWDGIEIPSWPIRR